MACGEKVNRKIIEGVYQEKADALSEPESYKLTKGNVTSIKGKA